MAAKKTTTAVRTRASTAPANDAPTPPAAPAATPAPASTPAPAAFSTLSPRPADPAAQIDYQVGAVPIRHNGAFYDVGARITLTDAEATRLNGLVVRISATKKME